jgi:serine/threonine protein kinase
MKKQPKICPIDKTVTPRKAINKCRNDGIVEKKIGQGSFGSVYSYIEPDESESAMKFSDLQNAQQIVQFFDEYETASEMSDLGIGFDTKDAFITTYERDDGTLGSKGYLFQTLADGDLFDFFNNNENKNSFKTVANKMMAQIKTMIYGPPSLKNKNIWSKASPVRSKGLPSKICMDMKPDNFLIYGNDVRMGDFGGFCHKRKYPEDLAGQMIGTSRDEEKKALLYTSLGIQTLAESNVVVNPVYRKETFSEAVKDLENIIRQYPRIDTAFGNVIMSNKWETGHYYRPLTYGESVPLTLTEYIKRIKASWV